MLIPQSMDSLVDTRSGTPAVVRVCVGSEPCNQPVWRWVGGAQEVLVSPTRAQNRSVPRSVQIKGNMQFSVAFRPASGLAREQHVEKIKPRTAQQRTFRGLCRESLKIGGTNEPEKDDKVHDVL